MMITMISYRFALLLELLLGLADQGEIAVFVEVVIRLKQDYILTPGSFIMIKV